MKKHFLLFACLLIWLTSPAQDIFTLKIKDTDGNFLPGIEVTAHNKTAKDFLKGTTDASGVVTFSLGKTGIYTFSYLDEKEFENYEVLEGFLGKSQHTVTYDPKKFFAVKEKPVRTGITFTVVPGQQLMGKPGVIQLNILVKNTGGTPVPNIPVELVSMNDKIKFTGKTNAEGTAVFQVPANRSYEVDVDKNESLKSVSVPNEKDIEMTEVVFYEKTVLNEIVKGDTIFQRDITQTNGTNTHLLLTIKLLNYEATPLADELVYLQAEGKKQVYTATTDKNGVCKFMLPKSANYIVNLKYEQGLHLVEAKNSVGFGLETITRRYRGSAEIERIMAEQEAEIKRLAEEEKLLQQRREEEVRIQRLALAEREKAQKELLEEKKKTEEELVGKFYLKKFVPTFRETPVRKASPPVDYLTKTPDGYNVDFKSSGNMGTPTVMNDKMFLPAGFYSTGFYCLKAQTGQFEWGVELGESGASPAVFHNGVILINTYSCTLYALDADSGKLLWSKWLSGTVYSTPTADGDKVYVVYRYGGEYVLSCFDLRSGAFQWINRVDSETIACPVVEGNEVHVASQSGFYYVFDKTSGKPIHVLTSVQAVSSPTLTPESIFFTARIEGKDQLVELDRKSFKIRKQYPTQLLPAYITDDHNCQNRMNFNGSHPVVYQNKYIVLTDESNLMVMDARSEKLLWKKPVRVTNNQVPLVVDDQVIVGTEKGVQSFDIVTGESKIVAKNTGAVHGQPVCNNGLLFLASSSILTVIRTVQNYQWNQWNRDASHNLYIK